MGSIAGPIISFRFNAPSAQQAAKQLSNVVGSTMAQASKSSANQFVSDWQAAAAKLRASISSEKLGLNSITQAREKIISLAQKEMAVLEKKNSLTRQELATLRSATMEIERQKNALEGFGSVTSPTRKIIQQMISGIGVRAGSYGGGFGSFAGVRVNESLGKMADEATGGRLALLGFGAAAVVVTAAMVDMAKHGAELAVSIRNASEAAGISVKNMVELKSAASTLGIDSDVTVKMFKKFNQELTYAMGANLPHASIEAKRAAEVFQLLGVNVQKAAADPMEGFRELSEALSKLPDGAVKSATEVMLLGRGGQEAAPLINHLSEALAATKESSDALAKNIGSAALAGDQLAVATTNLSNKWKELEVNLATLFVPTLSAIIGLINKGFSSSTFGSYFKSPQGALASGNSFLALLGLFGVMSGAKGSAPLGDMNSVLSALSQKYGGTVSADQLKLMQNLAGAETSDSTGGGRGRKGRSEDYSLPLYLLKLDKDYDEYLKFQEKILKEYLEHKKKVDEENSKNFQQLLAQTDIFGAMGIGLYSPDKTGEGIKGLMDSLNQAAKDTATKAAQDIVDAWKQWRDEGKSLFEDLLSGGQNFAKKFARDLEDIALKPVQNAFGNLIGNILYNLDKMVPNSIPSGKAGSKTGGGIFGKIFQGIQKAIQPPKSVQNAMETIQNAQITATNVYLYGNLTNIPKPGASNFTGSNFMDLFGGANNTSLTSFAGVGGFSMALAAAGGTAIAGSGGAAVAGGGGTAVAGGGGPTVSSIVGNTGAAMGGVSGRLLQTLGAAIPGGALMGIGLHNSNGQLTALGAGAMAQGALTTLGKLAGGTPGTSIFGGSNNVSDPGDAMIVGAQMLGGIGQIVAGSQVKGLGGVLQGAMGGAELGTAILPGIGTAIGAAVGGLISGVFGGGSAAAHQQGWISNINKAMANQRVTLPPSETFSFASGNSMASIFSTTFGQGPGGFSNSTLAANTPFWANAIYGTPRNTQAQIQWNALMNGLNTNLPFYGGSNNPFNGGPLPSGLRLNSGIPAGMYSPNSGIASTASSSGVQVHFTVPGYVDKAGLADIVKNAAPLIHGTVAQAVYRQSTGMRRSISRSINLP